MDFHSLWAGKSTIWLDVGGKELKNIFLTRLHWIFEDKGKKKKRAPANKALKPDGFLNG